FLRIVRSSSGPSGPRKDRGSTLNRPPDQGARYAPDAFSELPPFPDVRPAFELLRERGIHVVTLGNGSAATVRGLLERSGLAPLVQAVLSIEDAKHWKPQAAAYQHAEQKLGFRADQLALVAAHAWDVQGANRGGWLVSAEGIEPSTYGLRVHCSAS